MIIIPARLHSSRLPNKLLLPLGELPIIIKVANIAREVDSCIVACDSKEILEVCKAHKIEAILTNPNHKSGTDRCSEAANILKLSDDEIIINLQGDEPFIESSVISALKNAMEVAKDDIFMASCYKYITSKMAEDANLVKVVVDNNSCALYFSRSKIPYNRDNVDTKYLGHLGIYAFRKKSLDEFCKLGDNNIPKHKKAESHLKSLEEIERLEQLRALENGKKILMVEVESKSIGIDTIEDYHNALKLVHFRT